MVALALNVPLYRQPMDSSLCGSVAAKMVLEYYGRRFSVARIARETQGRCGLHELKLGTWFLRQGFDVTIIAWEPPMPASFIALGAAEAELSLRRWCRRKISQDSSWLVARDYYGRWMPKFIEAGGRFLPRPVTALDFRRALRRGVPPILSLDEALLSHGRCLLDPHYVVVTGMSREAVRINDPNYEPCGGIRTYSRDQLMHACHRIDGQAILVSPRP